MTETDPLDLQVDVDHENMPGRYEPFSTEEFYRFGHFNGLHDLVVETITHWKVMKWPFYHEFITITTRPGDLVSQGECTIPLQSHEERHICTLGPLNIPSRGLYLRIERGRVSNLTATKSLKEAGSFQRHTDTVEILTPHSPPFAPGSTASTSYETIWSARRRPNLPDTVYSLRVRDITSFALWITQATPDYDLFRRNCWSMATSIIRLTLGSYFHYQFDIGKREENKERVAIHHIPRRWFSPASGMHGKEKKVYETMVNLKESIYEVYGMKKGPGRHSPGQQTSFAAGETPDLSDLSKFIAKVEALVFDDSSLEQLGVNEIRSDPWISPSRVLWGYMLWTLDSSKNDPTRLPPGSDFELKYFIPAFGLAMGWLNHLGALGAPLPAGYDRIPHVINLFASIPKSVSFAEIGTKLGLLTYFNTLYLTYNCKKQTPQLSSSVATFFIPQCRELLVSHALSSILNPQILTSLCHLVGALAQGNLEAEALATSNFLSHLLRCVASIGIPDFLQADFVLVWFCQSTITREYIIQNPYLLSFVEEGMMAGNRSPQPLVMSAYLIVFLQPLVEHRIINLIEYGVISALIGLFYQLKWPVNHDHVQQIVAAAVEARPVQFLQHDETSRALARMALKPVSPVLFEWAGLQIYHVITSSLEVANTSSQELPSMEDLSRHLRQSNLLDALETLAKPGVYRKMDIDPVQHDKFLQLVQRVKGLGKRGSLGYYSLNSQAKGPPQ